jgi:hypothetical protein
VFIEHGTEAFQIGDVALEKRNAAKFGVVEKEAEAFGILDEVEDEGLIAAIEEVADDPAADAAIAAGEENAHGEPPRERIAAGERVLPDRRLGGDDTRTVSQQQRGMKSDGSCLGSGSPSDAVSRR